VNKGRDNVFGAIKYLNNVYNIPEVNKDPVGTQNWMANVPQDQSFSINLLQGERFRNG
jgi:hypothetical protein